MRELQPLLLLKDVALCVAVSVRPASLRWLLLRLLLRLLMLNSRHARRAASQIAGRCRHRSSWREGHAHWWDEAVAVAAHAARTQHRRQQAAAALTARTHNVKNEDKQPRRLGHAPANDQHRPGAAASRRRHEPLPVSVSVHRARSEGALPVAIARQQARLLDQTAAELVVKQAAATSARASTGAIALSQQHPRGLRDGPRAGAAAEALKLASVVCGFTAATGDGISAGTGSGPDRAR
jgi:hypothetical protein